MKELFSLERCAKVYKPNKPKKYGCEGLCCVTPLMCIVVNTNFTSGRQPMFKCQSYDLVMRMMHRYLNKGHHLFMDNYYSSPLLYANLWHMQTGCTGTVHASGKGIPKSIQHVAVEKRGHYSMKNNSLLLVKFQDKKAVYLLSTVETDTRVAGGRNAYRDTESQRTVPNIINVYNKNMNGVDRSDQMTSYNFIRMKTMKWWKRIFFSLINLALVYAYVLYKKHTGVRMGQKTFRSQVVQSLIKSTKESEIMTPIVSNEVRLRQTDLTLHVLKGDTFRRRCPTSWIQQDQEPTL